MSEVIMRERQLNIRLSEEESTRVDLVAEHYGLNVAALLRMLVKREFDALPLEVKKAPKKSAKK